MAADPDTTANDESVDSVPTAESTGPSEGTTAATSKNSALRSSFAASASTLAAIYRRHVDDTVRVGVRISEGNKERVNPYEGGVISNDTVVGSNHHRARIFQGIGVERVFMVHSPVASIKLNGAVSTWGEAFICGNGWASHPRGNASILRFRPHSVDCNPLCWLGVIALRRWFSW